MAVQSSSEQKHKIYCPKCGKWLLSVENDTKGTVVPFCKRCHAEVKIKLPVELH